MFIKMTQISVYNEYNRDKFLLKYNNRFDPVYIITLFLMICTLAISKKRQVEYPIQLESLTSIDSCVDIIGKTAKVLICNFVWDGIQIILRNNLT